MHTSALADGEVSVHTFVEVDGCCRGRRDRTLLTACRDAAGRDGDAGACWSGGVYISCEEEVVRTRLVVVCRTREALPTRGVELRCREGFGGLSGVEVELRPSAASLSKEGGKVNVLDAQRALVSRDGDGELHQRDVLSPPHQAGILDRFGLDLRDVQRDGALRADLDIPAIIAGLAGEGHCHRAVGCSGDELGEVALVA